MAAELVHTALLPTVPPFALGASLRAMSGFAPCAGDQIVTADRVRKAFPLSDTEAAVVEVAPGPDDVPGVAVAVFAERAASAGEVGAIESRIRRWLSLDDDLGPFIAIARRDPAMRPILAATLGLHQVRFASLAEATVYFTLTQRSTQWYAAARKRRIAAEVVAGVAALDEEWLRTAPYPEARDALLHVRGIGTFTGHGLLLRALGRPDAVPLEMAQFTGVAQAIYGDDPPSPVELRDWYGPYVGWWAYLCRTGLGWLNQNSSSAAA